MKHCPQCGAEYDDFVQYCFVDGIELKEGSSAAPKAPRHSTPLPIPHTQAGTGHSSSHSGSHAAAAAHPAAHTASDPMPVSSGFRPALAPPKQAQPTGNRTFSLWAGMLLLVPMVALFAVGGLLFAVFVAGAGSSQTASPQVPDPSPHTQPPPVPPPNPTAAPVSPVNPNPGGSSNTIQVSFESDPSGAEVWEQNQLLCAATPCVVPHPDYAPSTRNFVLKHEGYQDTPYEMTDPTAPQKVELNRTKTSKPRPRPGGDDILIER